MSIAGGGIELRPEQSGEVSFSAVVADPGGLSAQATVTVSVSNGSPIANADHVDVSDGAVNVDLLDNDSDPDGDDIRLQSVPGSASFDGHGRRGHRQDRPAHGEDRSDGRRRWYGDLLLHDRRLGRSRVGRGDGHRGSRTPDHAPTAENVAATVEAGAATRSH